MSKPRPSRERERDRAAEMLACVRASGLKLTPQRMAIVRELAADPTHPTAQELFERLRPALPTMSFATVYNTLDALANAGLCAALSLAPGPSRFDPNMRAHHHAVCDRCGLVRDVPTEPVSDEGSPSALGPLAAAPGFAVRAVERIYRGLCAACASAAAKGAAGAGPRKRAARAADG
jgi:Fe2+ or Zn2+ uptake regulation protein